MTETDNSDSLWTLQTAEKQQYKLRQLGDSGGLMEIERWTDALTGAEKEFEEKHES